MLLCIREQSYPSVICYFSVRYDNSFAALMMFTVCKPRVWRRCQNDGFLQDLISFHHKCNGTDCNLSTKSQKNPAISGVASPLVNTVCLPNFLRSCIK